MIVFELIDPHFGLFNLCAVVACAGAVAGQDAPLEFFQVGMSAYVGVLSNR